MNATAPPTPPQPAPEAPHGRRLRRDTKNKVLGGVAAGVARTYGIDTTLVRVLFVIAAFFWVGIPVYIVAWIVMPPDDGTGPLDEHPRDIGLLAGLALIGIGALIATDRVIPHAWQGHAFAAPLFLIGGGLAILVLRRPQLASDTEGTEAAEGEAPPPPPTTEPAIATAPAADEPTVPHPESAWTQAAPWPTARSIKRDARREQRARRPRPFLGPLTFSALLIGAGVTSLLQATGAIDVNLTVAFAIATCFVGAVLVLSAWFGRARGLIFLGILLAAATAVSSALDVPLHGGIGERIYHPRTVAGVRAEYELGIGHMKLNLRDVRFTDGTTNVKATVGIGRLEVDVPSTAAVEIDAHVGAGARKIFGQQSGGWQRDDRFRAPSSETGNTAVLHLDLRVGAGEIDVHRFLPDGSETLIGAS